ncbi:MAG: hypothetical protein L0Z55_08520 [Planctomycetes bacterium]|nr:hypothetical protein [Planctomycetota bacterium]
MSEFDVEQIPRILVRWVHILAAIAAVGGLLFLRFVHLPAAQEALSEDARARLREEVMRRWRRLVNLGIALLFLTGVYNFLVIGIPKGKVAPYYHMLFGVKFLAAMGVFFIASALVGRSPTFAAMRERPSFWLTVNAALAVLLILISSTLRHIE